jgi:hypothetical protein
MACRLLIILAANMGIENNCDYRLNVPALVSSISVSEY